MIKCDSYGNCHNSPLATAYLLEVKGHYTSDWDYLTMDYSMGGIINITAFASSGAQTVITLSGSGGSQVELGFSDHWSITVPSGGKLDFRLEAINGEVGSRSIWCIHICGRIKRLESNSNYNHACKFRLCFTD